MDYGCLDRMVYGTHFDIKYGFDNQNDNLNLNSMKSLELGKNNTIPMVVNRIPVNETVILEQYGIIKKTQIPSSFQKLESYIGCYKITTTEMVLIRQREIKGPDHVLVTIIK